MLNSRCRLVGKQQIAASVGVGNAGVVGPTIAVVADEILIEKTETSDPSIENKLCLQRGNDMTIQCTGTCFVHGPPLRLAHVWNQWLNVLFIVVSPADEWPGCDDLGLMLQHPDVLILVGPEHFRSDNAWTYISLVIVTWLPKCLATAVADSAVSNIPMAIPRGTFYFSLWTKAWLLILF